MLTLATALYLWAKFSLDRIQHDAREFEETGIALNRLMTEYATALKQRDVEVLMSLHDDRYSTPMEGIWQLSLTADRDGARVYSWILTEKKVYAKADIRKQVEHYFAGVGQLDETKFKIASIEKLGENGSATVRGVLLVRGRTAKNETMESHATFRLALKGPFSTTTNCSAKSMN